MKYPQVLDLAAEGIPVAATYRALGFSRQAFYAWNAPIGIHRDEPAFGYRFIAGELAVSGLSARLSTEASQSTNAPAGPAYTKETCV